MHCTETHIQWHVSGAVEQIEGIIEIGVCHQTTWVDLITLVLYTSPICRQGHWILLGGTRPQT